MNALHELCALRLMTFAARTGNVDLGDRRLWIGCGTDVVTVVTVSANSSGNISLRQRFRVHTFTIRKERPVANAASLHYRFVSMTAAAGFGDVTAIDS